MKLDVVILAAGKGSRMYSNIPKVLHPIAGKAMVQHVVDSVKALGADLQLHVVIGHGAELVENALDADCQFVLQAEQLGTGHAVAQALPNIREGAKTLILYGDVPLIQTTTLENMVAQADDRAMSLLTVRMDDPTGYGRIVRSDGGDVQAIVEHKDANAAQLAIDEVNTGIMCIHQADLARWLPNLSNDNAQGEYYLTDVIEVAVKDDIAVNTVNPGDDYEVVGVNNKLQLAELERSWQQEIARDLLTQGVTLADPSRIDVRGELTVGKDVFIDVNCVFIGNVSLADNVSIGPNCVVIESTLEDGVEVLANSVIEESALNQSCTIGPYARLRPGAELGRGAKIGNFVEVKKSIIGEGSKVNHLSYVGDAEIGDGCNIGAGTITCNYDGANKFKTTMGDNVFVGSNSTLVAPLAIRDNGFVGAGSTITQEVPSYALAVGRGKQKNIPGWKRPAKKKS